VGAFAKRVLITLHRGLQGIGRGIGHLTLFVLAIGLYLTPIVAVIMASFFAAGGVSEFLGGGRP
jgi:hypothetical protein